MNTVSFSCHHYNQAHNQMKITLLCSLVLFLLLFLTDWFWRMVAMTSARFSQPGNWKSLLLRIGLLVFLIGLMGMAWKQRAFIHKGVRILKQAVSARHATQMAKEQDPIYPVVTREEQADLNQAIRLSFAGDLILLRDAAENGWCETSNKYDYAPMFQEVSEYWKSADLAIGVFEGPMAGPAKGYSTSTYGDGIPLYLNFPDEFAAAVKEAGIGLVTTANNHVLDMGTEGLYRTLDTLDGCGLDHLGSYRNPQEKSKVKIRYVKGKKIAFLAYTYGSNYHEDDFFFQDETSYLTNIIVSPHSKWLPMCMKQVEADFQRAKAENPDLIVVLPHMGTQFLHAPDDYQNYWTDVFSRLGANIIFSDHSHAVQPIEWRKNSKGNVLVVHCPGNYVNSYAPYDGDASMLVDAYLDPATGLPMACSCIPVYAYSDSYGSDRHAWIGLPVYKAMTEERWQNRLSHRDEERIQEVHEIVTASALGHRLSSDQVPERYFSFPGQGYKRNPVQPLANEAELQGPVADAIRKADKIAFVGDSVTEGTKNGGYGWHEPLVASFPGKKVECYAKGGATSSWFLDNKRQIAALGADLYVVAFDCNDIRYRDADICAMDAETYICRIHTLVQEIQADVGEKARFVFVSPWESASHDPFCKADLEEKQKPYDSYSRALEKYCEENGYIFSNPNPYIGRERSKRYWACCMKDHIHPDAKSGIRLYAQGVLNGTVKQ